MKLDCTKRKVFESEHRRACGLVTEPGDWCAIPKVADTTGAIRERGLSRSFEWDDGLERTRTRKSHNPHHVVFDSKVHIL